jgi:RNA polymerase sigma factor (sigma-70 family)
VWEASDEALLAGYATGDRDAGLAFVRRFQAKVFGLVLLITRNPHDAEDAAQEAFIRTWRYASSYDARRGTVSAWVLGIARNVALDRIRIVQRRPENLFPELPPEQLLEQVAASDLAEQSSDVAAVLAAVRSLPPEQREAIAATTLLGLSGREISEATGAPLGTVKTRIRLGLRKVRDELGVHAE